MAVIQVPLLNPRPDSVLDNILTIFDQKNLDPNDKRIMWYDIDDYDVPKGELRDEMRVMVRRLETAVVDEKVQMQMDLEDRAEEIFAAKLNAEEKLAEQEKLLAEKEKIMAENEKILTKNKEKVAEQAKMLQEKDSQIIDAMKIMHSHGVGIDTIATTFNKDVKFVEEALKL